jgi:hypothetical protein
LAKPLKIPYEEALAGIQKQKQWTAGPAIDWVQTSVNHWPFAYRHRSVLKVGNILAEGLVLQLEYKGGVIDGLPERLYFTLLVGGARVFGVDEDGVTSHVNRAGLGQPYFQQTIGHPHIHLPVPEASYGYAEPIDRVEVEMLWQHFLERANITGAPRLNLPGMEGPDGQLRLI